MFRKTAIALGTFAALGLTALVPTSASAYWYGYHHHHYRYFSYHYHHDYNNHCYWVKKWTHYGPQFYKVCDYD